MTKSLGFRIDEAKARAADRLARKRAAVASAADRLARKRAAVASAELVHATLQSLTGEALVMLRARDVASRSACTPGLAHVERKARHLEAVRRDNALRTFVLAEVYRHADASGGVFEAETIDGVVNLVLVSLE